MSSKTISYMRTWLRRHDARLTMRCAGPELLVTIGDGTHTVRHSSADAEVALREAMRQFAGGQPPKNPEGPPSGPSEEDIYVGDALRDLDQLTATRTGGQPTRNPEGPITGNPYRTIGRQEKVTKLLLAIGAEVQLTPGSADIIAAELAGWGDPEWGMLAAKAGCRPPSNDCRELVITKIRGLKWSTQ